MMNLGKKKKRVRSKLQWIFW